MRRRALPTRRIALAVISLGLVLLVGASAQAGLVGTGAAGSRSRRPRASTPGTATLTIDVTGSGSGGVAATDGSITCGSTCSASYADGTVVTLGAAPAAGSSFAGWSGGGCSGTGQCVVDLTQDTTVTAQFATATPGTPTITKVTKDAIRRIVTFTFGATGEKGGFKCALTPKGARVKLANCSSPLTYHKVNPGTYTFTTEVAGGTPATRQLTAPIEFANCFGAASRDPEHKCGNPALRDAVVPTPTAALLIPLNICRDPTSLGAGSVCGFGVPPGQGSANIALIGDSHGAHWLPALQYAALAKGWTGYALIHNGCGFSKARMLVAASYADQCQAWSTAVLGWLWSHPAVTRVVISGFDTRLYASSSDAGFHAMWNALPPWVHSIDIIRDTPAALLGESDCITNAIAHHEPAGPHCAKPRSQTLLYDREAAAAGDAKSARVHLFDYTPFFCDNSRCYGVIGGALVYKDLNHMTVEFDTTMGPYVLRSLDQIG